MSNPFNRSNNSGGGQKREFVEEIKVSGKNLVSEVERLLKETEVRRLRIRQGDKVLLDIPVAWAALGVIVAPVLAAVGAVASVATNCTIEVTRTQPSGSQTPPAPAPTQTSKPAPAPKPATPASKESKSPDDVSFR